MCPIIASTSRSLGKVGNAGAGLCQGVPGSCTSTSGFRRLSQRPLSTHHAKLADHDGLGVGVEVDDHVLHVRWNN
jgi:hypothetical protein